MNPDTAVQSFELRRFPDLRAPAARFLWFFLVLQLLQHWLRTLIFIGWFLIYWLWRRRRPASHLRLSNAEILLNAGLLRRLQISRQQVQEVSPSTTGVIIAWKKSGVPHYTHVRSEWFEDAVWRKAFPALLSWGTNR